MLFSKTLSKAAMSKEVKDKLFANPVEKLEKLLVLPFLKPHEAHFRVTENILEQAQKVFTPSRDHDIKLLASVANPERFPKHDIPEVILDYLFSLKLLTSIC